MKILINCYACSPYKGSEPGMGWNFIKSLCRLHELHIITESKFQQDLNQYFEEHPEEKPFYHFYFIEKERHKKLRKIWPPSYYWFYKAWQKKALILAKTLDQKENFDVIHQLNMVGYREPGCFYKLNKPLVWGPIGGMCISPWCLLPSTGIYGTLYYGFRNLINIYQMHFKTRVRSFAKSSSAIISATQDNHDGILKRWGKESIIIPEVGMLEDKQKKQISPRSNNILKIAWSGQHTPGKALNLLLEAISISNLKDNIELHVIGQGKYTLRWKRLAKRYHLNNIIWHGWVKREEAISIMKECNLFCITSIADLTSTVLLEALSYGLPVIALNHCGFSNVITIDCGIKIDIHSKKQVVNDFAQAIKTIYNNEEWRIQMSQNALKRASDFTWEEKATQIDNIYHQISL
jgi:glycosyltransferase involved in cell wall biosynthesis